MEVLEESATKGEGEEGFIMADIPMCRRKLL